MNTITTTLTWTRFDGAPETLPEEGVFVLLVGKTKVRERMLHTDCESGTSVWAGVFEPQVPTKVGDTWAYWPEAPEVPE